MRDDPAIRAAGDRISQVCAPIIFAFLQPGAIIGLTIGYGVKYSLDRRFVSTDQRLNSVP